MVLNDQLDDTKQMEKELTTYMENEHKRNSLFSQQATEASSIDS
jgi:spore coat protein CotF